MITDSGKPTYSEKILYTFHVVHHKYHTDYFWDRKRAFAVRTL
jgi:hypothetical protein